MNHRLLNTVTSVSLLACLAAVVSWGRSYRTGDSVLVTWEARTVSVTSEGGSCAFATFVHPQVDGVRWTWGSYAKRCGAAAAARRLLVFGWAPEIVGAHDFVAPHWIVAAVFGALPAARAAGRVRRRHTNANACRRCGYDLTGNVSGVCPECGTAR